MYRWWWLTYLTLSTSSTWGHRATTVSFHLRLSMAAVFVSFQVLFIFCSSDVKPRRQVFLGLPLFRCPWGFHSKACFVTFVSFFRSVWPIHLHFLVLIWCSIGSWFVLFQRSLLEIVSGHRMPSMFRRHRFIKVWILLLDATVSFQVSEPYNRTDLTFELKILIFVLVLKARLQHMGHSIWKACCALVFLVAISSSVPPVVLTTLPR